MKNKLMIFLTLIFLVLATLLLGVNPVQAATNHANSTGTYYLPFKNGRSVYVTRAGTDHANAIDFAVPAGTPIYAARGGVIKQIVEKNTQSKCDPTYAKYNNQVTIYDNATGETQWYLHLSTNSVPDNLKVGDTVPVGTYIGKSGAIGYVCGAHLHFHVTKQAVRVNPKFYERTGGTLISKGTYKSKNPTTPPAPTLASPSNGASLAAGAITFTWNAVSPASGYYIEILSGATVIRKPGWRSGTSFTTTLPVGSYTWRVKARNAPIAADEGPWSATWAFTIPAISEIPVLKSPANGATLPPSTPVTFEWYAAIGATEYRVTWSGPTPGSGGGSEWVAGTTYDASVLLDGSYTWYVEARNAAGVIKISDAWSFTIQAAPADIVIIPRNYEFNWSTSGASIQPQNTVHCSSNPDFNQVIYWRTTDTGGWVKWRPNISIAGYYEVFVYIPDYTHTRDLAHLAKYYLNETTLMGTVDQAYSTGDGNCSNNWYSLAGCRRTEPRLVNLSDE